MNTCLSCQYEAHRAETGEWPTPQAANHCMMWGCTCTHQAAAMTDMQRITR